MSGPVRRRVDWRVRGGIAAALSVVGIASITYDRWDEQESVDARALRLERTYGIRIGYEDPADFWAPPYKPEDATSPKLSMTRAERGDAAISLEAIEAALQQYPPGFVAKLFAWRRPIHSIDASWSS